MKRPFITALACLISVSLICQNDYSLNFDGENDFVDLSDVTSLLHTSGSISMDFKIPANQIHDIDENQFVNPSYGLFAIDNTLGDPLVVRIGAGCYSESSTISIEDDDCGQSNANVRAFYGNDSYQLFDNQWHNLTLVSNESGHELFLDGQPLTLTYTLGDSSINLWPTDYSICKIGSGLFDASAFLGKIDNVSIWEGALSENQIQEYITCKPNGDEEGLIGYWNFNEGQGDMVFDLSPNLTQGLIYGATWSTDTPNQNCVVEGCLDESACNYDSNATTDDGSCEYITPVDLGDDIETCEESVTLDAGPGYNSYLWNTGETTQTIEVNESGDYSVEVSNGGLNDFSMSFDGIDDYVQISHSDLFQNTEQGFTIQFDLYPYNFNDPSTPSADYLIWKIDESAGDGANGKGFDIGFNNPGLFFRYSPGPDAPSTIVVQIDQGDLPLNSFSHISFVTSESHLLAYVNGNLVSSEALPSYYFEMDFGISDIYIGKPLYPASGYIAPAQAQIDNLQIWNRGLNSVEVNEFMTCNPGPNEIGLVGFWNFENGNGNTVLDITENDNNGIVNGATWSNVTPEQSCLFCESSDSITIAFNTSGCTDQNACNYDAEATCDDGSCEYITPVDLGDDIETCEESVTLDAGEGYDSYLWSTGETTQSIEVNETGNYNVEVSNNNNSSLYFDSSQNNNMTSIGLDGEFVELSFFTKVKLNSNEFNQQLFYFGEEFSGNNTTGSIDLTIDQINYNPSRLQINLNYNHGIAGTQNYNLDTWLDIAGVFDGENQILSLYINGELVDSSPTTVNSILFTEDVVHRIGAGFSNGTTANYFDGTFDYILIFDKIINEDEIISFGICPPSENTDGLVTYWNFNQGDGDIAIDLSGNNNGTINGATWSNDTPEQSCLFCESSDAISITFNSYGCTDQNACNYDSEAICDDGSCEYITPVDLGDDLETCDESVTLDAGSGYDSYLWSTGETTQTIEVTTSGDYSVEVENISDQAIHIDENTTLTSENLFSGYSDGNFSILVDAKLESEGILFQSASPHATLTYSSNCFCSAITGDFNEPSISFRVWSGGWTVTSVSVTDIDLSQCLNIAGVYEDNTVKLYVNGMLVDSETGNVSNASGVDIIGSYGFSGILNNFSIFNTALSSSDIQNYSFQSLTGQESSLLNAFNFNGNASSITSSDEFYSASDLIYTSDYCGGYTCSIANSIEVVFNDNGCSDVNACNYDLNAICDDGSCLYFDECGECGGNGTLGCTDMSACNYDSEADCDDESCTYPIQYYDCNGNCLNDIDEDGVCNELEIPGCTDQEADNYDASATDDDGMCEYLGCTNPIAENYDSTANVDDGSCVILGCMDSDAANYNIEANQDDASCLYDIDYVNDSYNDGYEDGVDSVDCPLCPPCDNDCPGDYTGDGSVTVGDLLEFLTLFGNQCE